MTPDKIAARIQEIIIRIRRARSSLYPKGWTFDPLFRIEQELEGLLEDLKR